MNRPIYLDYAATTPVHPDVRAAMLTTLEANFGNPSSMHTPGRQAAKLIQGARQQVADAIGCVAEEVYFTSGATEADNLALFGVMRKVEPAQGHLITTSVEHHAVLHAARQLEREGFAVTLLPVDSHGRIDPEVFRQSIRSETRLVSVMLVNNEVGTLQPVAEIARIAHEVGILVHTDAVQGIGLPGVGFNALDIDLLSLSAHKIYGPKGIGALVVRKDVELEPLLHGGAQEGTLRPGTENVPGIAGLGVAIQLVSLNRQEMHAHLTELRTNFCSKLRGRIPEVLVNGGEEVAPHVISVSFPGADGEMILIRLNGEGFAVSLGSACTSKSIEPSHVLTAMGLPLEQVEGTLRISLGYPTTHAELDALIEILPSVVERARI